MRLVPNYCQHPDYWNPGIHLLYVGDRYRLDPYREAIRQVVRPGMIVADIGTGSGPLARFAAEAGASRVYGIEQYREILRYAERFNQTEGLDHVIEPVHGDSRSVSLNERVDVIVAELIASLGNDEAMSDIPAVPSFHRASMFSFPRSMPPRHMRKSRRFIGTTSSSSRARAFLLSPPIISSSDCPPNGCWPQNVCWTRSILCATRRSHTSDSSTSIVAARERSAVSRDGSRRRSPIA
jgi:hypothetical protein